MRSTEFNPIEVDCERVEIETLKNRNGLFSGQLSGFKTHSCWEYQWQKINKEKKIALKQQEKKLLNNDF